MMMKTMDNTTHYSPVVMAWLLEMQAWVTVWEGTETGMPAVQCCRIKVEHAIAIAGGTLGQMPSVTDSYCHCITSTPPSPAPIPASLAILDVLVSWITG